MGALGAKAHSVLASAAENFAYPLAYVPRHDVTVASGLLQASGYNCQFSMLLHSLLLS